MLGKEINKAFLIFALFFVAFGAWAYDKHRVHPNLTRASAEIYNREAGQKLAAEQINWMAEGSIAEDTDPRYVNHFYNPKTGQGLSACPSALTCKASKVWAKSQDSATGDYSWEQTLENYKKGDYKRAYQGVGHILHLIQDLASPAHVRNDDHRWGDPYEEWAKNNGHINLSRASFIQVESLDQAFDELASYTHANFFSKDTVKVKNPEKYKREKAISNGENVTYFINSIENKDYKLFYSRNPDLLFPIYKLDDFKIHLDYWNMLSPKAIGYGAGVIDLFMQEFLKIDAQREKPSFKQKAKQFFSRTNLQEKIKYNWGDDFLSLRTKVVDDGLVKGWIKYKKLERELGFFHEANQELIAQATEEGLEYIQKLEKQGKQVKSKIKLQNDFVKEKSNKIEEFKQKFREMDASPKAVIQEPIIAKPKIIKPIQIPPQKKINKPIEIKTIQEKIPKKEIKIIKLEEKKLKKKEKIKTEKIKIEPIVVLDEKPKIAEIVENIAPIQNNALQNIPHFKGFSPGFIAVSGGSLPPETRIAIKPDVVSSSSKANFIFSSDQANTRFAYNYNDNGWTEISTQNLNILNLEDGSHSILVKAINSQGQEDAAPEQYNWEVDTQAPVIAVLSAPSYASSTEASFVFADHEIASWRCSLDSSQAQTCGATTTISNLSEGEHSFWVEARDAVNNLATSGYNFIVDLTAPTSELAIIEPYYFSSAFSLSWSGNDALGATTTSGLAGFDLDYQIGTSSWQSLAIATTSASLNFNENIDLGSDVSFRLRANDNAGNQSEWGSAATTRVGTSHLVISEIQVSGASSTDEFVEIYNPTDASIDLSGYSLQYRGSNSESFEKKNFESGDLIQSHGYFLIGSNDYSGSQALDMNHASFSLSGVGANVFLVGNQTLLTDNTATSSVVLDRVAYGAGSYLFSEGSIYENAPGDNQSLERKALASSTAQSLAGAEIWLGNGYDLDDNSGDFVLRSAADPQNTSSPVEPQDEAINIPGRINDLAVLSASSASATLAWSAPVNANLQEGAYYDLRYFEKVGDCNLALNWENASQASGEAEPNSNSGATENFTLLGLNSSQEYCFGIRSFNGNAWSSLSNGVSYYISSIAIDAISSDKSDYGGSISWEHACSGEDRLLVVVVSNVDNNTSSGVTYAGQAMTNQINATRGSNPYFTGANLQIYYLADPPLGANMIEISGGKEQVGLALSLTGVNIADSLDTFLFTDSKQGDQVSLDLSVNYPGSLIIEGVVAGKYTGVSSPIPLGSQIKASNDYVDKPKGYKATAMSYQYASSAGSYPQEWSFSQSPQGTVYGAIVIRGKE